MSPTNYYRGRAREYRAIRELRESGWVCTRSAMSHGPVDIVAARSGRVLLIQVKSGSARASKEELRTLKKWARAFNADAQLWSFPKRLSVRKITIHRAARSNATRKKDNKITQPMESSTTYLSETGRMIGASTLILPSLPDQPPLIPSTS